VILLVSDFLMGQTVMRAYFMTQVNERKCIV
jgi:hypothetical protein